MKRTIKLAVKAKGRTSPNPLVGAIIVNNGKIVGEGYHKKAGTPHAEVNALKEAGTKAKGSTVYVNLEPCSHFGKTSPCADALIKAGVKKVVVAMVDPNPKVAGRGIEKLRANGVEVEVGLLEAEAKALNKYFIKRQVTNIPYIIYKTAMTLDGKIATETGDSKWVTGSEARHRVHQLRDEVDGILVGINTVLQDDPQLNTRLPEGGENPVKIILDSYLKLPINSKVVTLNSKSDTIVFCNREVSKVKLKELTDAGVKAVPVSGSGEVKSELDWVLKWLANHGLNSILVEGGATIAASFVTEGFVDEIWWFIAPKLVGGSKAFSPIGDMGITKMEQAVPVEVVSTEVLGKDILIKGNIKRGENKPCLQV